MQDQLLPRDDRHVAEFMADSLAAEGVQVLTGFAAREFTAGDNSPNGLLVSEGKNLK